jgi:hypothetical protein
VGVVESVEKDGFNAVDGEFFFCQIVRG